VATDSVHNLQNRARGAESVLVEVSGRDGNVDFAAVQRRLEQVSGVSRVVRSRASRTARVLRLKAVKVLSAAIWRVRWLSPDGT